MNITETCVEVSSLANLPHGESSSRIVTLIKKSGLYVRINFEKESTN